MPSNRSLPLSAVAALFAAALLLAPTGASVADEGARIARTFEKLRPSVVPIHYTLRLAESPEGGQGSKVEGVICGVVTSENGLVVTTADVFPDLDGDPRQTYIPEQFLIQARDGSEYAALAVGIDRKLNLAFLRATGNLPIPAVEFSSRAPKSGEAILLIGLLGEPYGYAQTFTQGRVVTGLDTSRPMYAFDAMVQDLTIGGLVVTPRGEALGIIGEDLLTSSPGNPSEMAASGNVLSLFASMSQGNRPGYPMIFPYQGLLDGLLDNPPPLNTDRWANRGWLGIIMQPLSEELAEYWSVPGPGGVIIGAVLDGSPAERAGLQVGDIILEVDHAPVRVREQRDLTTFRELVQATGAGREVPLAVFREGNRQTVALTLGNRPKTVFLAEEHKDENFGLTVKELTFDFIQGVNLPAGTRGVFISEIKNAGWADVAGLGVSDVIGKINGNAVENVGDFVTAMAEVTEQQAREVLFFVRRGSRTLFIPAKTDW